MTNDDGPMFRLALCLLGPPRLELNGEEIRISRRKAVALLAYLAVTGRSHSRDSLATLLWPELDQSTSRARLRRALAALRKAIGDGWLDADLDTVGLVPDADSSASSVHTLWMDVDAFREKVAECETHGHPPMEACSDCLPLLEVPHSLRRPPGNQDVIIGRGRLPLDASDRAFLRMERVGDQVRALCSVDGEDWFTAGHVAFPVEDPIQVGLHAIGNIDRTIYHGAYPDGAAIRFESFQLWGLDS